MSKEQVMDYVMNSPANTNPNVLSGMLDSIAQSGGGTVEVIKIATATLYTGTIDSTTGLFASTGGAFDGNKTLGDAVSNKKIVGFHFVPKDNVPTFGTLSASNASQELFDVIKNAEEAYQLTGYNIGLCQPKKTWKANDTIDIYAICI